MHKASQNSARQVVRKIRGMETSDGAGVSLTRIIGMPGLLHHDPFLLLDAFHSDDPDDYIAGFPPHPHRGFETVTYLIEGHMRHEDSAGHAGVIETGGVQWMTAGRGIIHSEMPQQDNGMLYGFQLWVNLPASQKMIAPRYQELGDADIPVESREGARVKVIAGRTSQGTEGPVRDLITPVLYFDVLLKPHADFSELVPQGDNAFIHVFDGLVELGGEPLQQGEMGILSDGMTLSLRAADTGARFLLIAGRPLNEPIARRGPFVMNTEAELQQAFRDYQSGTLGRE